MYQARLQQPEEHKKPKKTPKNHKDNPNKQILIVLSAVFLLFKSRPL